MRSLEPHFLFVKLSKWVASWPQLLDFRRFENHRILLFKSFKLKKDNLRDNSSNIHHCNLHSKLVEYHRVELIHARPYIAASINFCQYKRVTLYHFVTYCVLLYRVEWVQEKQPTYSHGRQLQSHWECDKQHPHDGVGSMRCKWETKAQKTVFYPSCNSGRNFRLFFLISLHSRPLHVQTHKVVKLWQQREFMHCSY